MAENRYRKAWEFPKDNYLFDEIREKGQVYVDKTGMIKELVSNKCVFLSRPRRFGKSMLCSTLKCYFEGRKELFKGLAIDDNKEWIKYPVFHFDMSNLKDMEPEEVKNALLIKLQTYETLYGSNPLEDLPGTKLQGLVERAHQKTGIKAVILIDEYDAALLHLDSSSAKYDEIQKILRSFYLTLKFSSDHLRFSFITGITKFSHVSIFSELNNLFNISMNDDYAAICGITENELHDIFDDDIENLAIKSNMTKEEMYHRLKSKYDGYHFSENSPETYNPFSLMLAFANGKLGNYWFSTGTPSFLFDKMKQYKTDLMRMNETLPVEASDFDMAIEDMNTAFPLLYQAGYLTIKKYNSDTNTYILGIPNEEVRTGFFGSLLRTITPLDNEYKTAMIADFNKSLRAGDIDSAMKALQSFLAGVPYMYEGKALLEDLEKLEALHERDLYLLFNGMGLNLETQVTQAKGRVDMVVWLPDTIYIFEFKMHGTAASAIDQIEKIHYEQPYLSDPRKKVKVGVRFTARKHTITSWKTKVD